MQIRAYEERDRKSLLAWLDRKTQFREALTERQFQAARQQRRQDEPALWLALQDEQLMGLLGWELNQHELDTGRPVASLWEFHYPDPETAQALYQASLPTLRDRPRWLVEVDPKSPEKQFWLNRGFQPERHRIGRVPERHNLNSEAMRAFSLKEGGPANQEFVTTLAVTNLDEVLPPGRSQERSLYLESTLRLFQNLDYGGRHRLFLVRYRHRAIGYLILDLQDSEDAYLLDMGVRRAHWGQRAAQFLVRSAENFLVTNGYQYLYAQVSAANRRSYLTARRSLGFQDRRIILHYNNGVTSVTTS